MLELDRYLVDETPPVGRYVGKIVKTVGLTMECRGIHASLGDLCRVSTRSGGTPILTEVVGFREGSTVLMPFEEVVGLSPGSTVRPLARRFSVSCGRGLLGRVVDAAGRPIDEKGPIAGGVKCEVQRTAPTPAERRHIEKPLETGISAIDGLFTLGQGQRLGIFAGSGVGKSSLMGTIAKRARADVFVIGLIGERGREVKEFVDLILGPEGLKRSVVVSATSDATPLMRYKGAFTAVTIAEYFRDQGLDVLLMMDSVTRLAGAIREIGLALGEPPTVRGYPPSFFSTMPRLVERLGRTRRGSITGLLTVLVDSDDMNEPVADTLRGLLDGHIVLSRKIAARNQYPAIDVLSSVSRVMDAIVPPEQVNWARTLRENLAVYEESRDLIAVGAYRSGSDQKIDAAVNSWPVIEKTLKQPSGSGRSWDETMRCLQAVTLASTSGPRGKKS